MHELHLALGDLHRCHPAFGREKPQLMGLKQQIDWPRQGPEAIPQFLTQPFDPGLVGDLSQLAVDLDSLGGFPHVIERQVCRELPPVVFIHRTPRARRPPPGGLLIRVVPVGGDTAVPGNGDVQGRLTVGLRTTRVTLSGPFFTRIGGQEIQRYPNLDPSPDRFTLQHRNTLAEQLAIQVEAHRSDVAALLGTEQIARTSNLQVAHGDLETATQRTVLLNGTHPFAGLGQQLGVAWQHQVAIGLVLVATHTAAELV